MEPVYRVQRREPRTEPVERIEPVHLLTPAEREAARRRREEKRRELAERSGKRPPENSTQEPGQGTDYLV